MGRRTRKSVAALVGRLPACNPARPRSAGRVSGRRGGGVRHGIQRGRRGPPGMGAPRRRLQRRSRGLTATTSRRGRRVAAKSRCHGSNRDGLSRPLAAGMRTGSLAACGSPPGIAGGVRLAAWNGYGDAQRVRRKKEDS